MAMTESALDFGKVEILRKRMGLNTEDFSKALGVSRMTYYHWVRGKNMRSSQSHTVSRKIKLLLDAYSNGTWDEIKDVPRADRRERLLAMVA